MCADCCLYYSHAMQDKSASGRPLMPGVALVLSAVHSIVIYNPPKWVRLPAQLAIDQLLDLDLQVLHLQL
jgi:hypothetical protein